MFRVAALCFGVVHSTEVYGTVVTSPPLPPLNEKHIFNLVNRASEQSITNSRMTLASGMSWVGPTELFAEYHLVGDYPQAIRNCEFVGRPYGFGCFKKTKAYYYWSKGYPISSPITCQSNQTCIAKATHSIISHLKYNIGAISVGKLVALVSNRYKNIPLDYKDGVASPTNINQAFVGPNRKQLKFKSLFFTVEGKLELHNFNVKNENKTSSLLHNVVMKFPIVIPKTGAGSGVYYLEDA
ncbi:hypothetical protein DSO57_1013997 [Entomophthora muscae]|uniref:Uncharacterized protein n=1 Tax=Entomophthora muscae TaxID=34485 RepID=A0ACC2TU47_9FUNG|nr:hypothetical protein DSO57_1013997 [Entomophthora muscae]